MTEQRASTYQGLEVGVTVFCVCSREHWTASAANARSGGRVSDGLGRRDRWRRTGGFIDRLPGRRQGTILLPTAARQFFPAADLVGLGTFWNEDATSGSRKASCAATRPRTETTIFRTPIFPNYQTFTLYQPYTIYLSRREWEKSGTNHYFLKI